MSFFFRSFAAALHARLSRWRTWVLLLLFPLTAFGAVRLMPPEEVSSPVQVGVVLPEAGGGDFWSRLEARSGLAVTFHAAGRREAERNVALGRWDCALVLPEDFQERLDRLDTAELFTLLTGPGSAVYPLVRETAAACVFECISPSAAERYLLDSGIVDPSAAEGIRPRLNEALPDRERVLVSLETADGQPLDPLSLADSGVSRLMLGLTAILLLVWALFTAMDLGRWLDSPFARRLAPLWGTTALLLPRLAGSLVPALCAGALALAAAGNSLSELPALAAYLLFWGAAALLLARCRPLWSALPVLLPFAPAAGLLLSPVLLDLSLLFPALGPAIRWNPVTLCLRAGAGRGPDGLLLAGAGAALLLLSLALDHGKNGGRS